MNIDDMRYMLKIAEQGSITKASEVLFITQPTLSQRLQKVENELGTRLFERNRFGEVSLTEAGNRFCSECRHILAHWQLLQEGLQALRGRQTLTMGIPVRIGYQLVAGLVDKLEAEYPHISLTFLDHPNYLMEEMVARGELDLALIRLAAPNSNYSLRLLTAPMPIVHLRKGSPLWDKVYYHPDDPVPYIDLRLLENEPLVGPPASRAHRQRLWLDTILAQIPNFHGRILYTVPNVNMYDHYVKSGTASYIFASFRLPEYACRLESEYELPYSLYLVQNKQTDPQAADIIYRILLPQMDSIL